MRTEEIKNKIREMCEEDAFFTLFYVVLKKNNYYDNIRKFAESYEGGFDKVVADIQSCYDNSAKTPYEFLDAIEDYLAACPDCTLTIGEIVDEIYS